ncbi:hypothetical protein [Kalamiella sp. sgz302252]|uniref:hypothetical protein n=1 Tax=Pantoea sp. sgz302252 TaxID=3341827 RepID=UPI0036D3FE5E
MKIIIFFIVFVAAMVFIPNSLLSSLVEHHVHISGDGEEAMDSFEFTVIAAKVAVSTVAALVALWLYRKRKA